MAGHVKTPIKNYVTFGREIWKLPEFLSISWQVVISFTLGICPGQGLSQDLETGCPKLPIVKFWGILIFKGDKN